MRVECRYRAKAACILMMALASGCGEDGPRLVPVAGVVTINAAPLEQANVAFVPDPGNEVVTPGVGTSGPDGTYVVRHGVRPGLAPGRYKVLISKKELKSKGVVIPKAFENDPLQQELMGIRKETLPRKYSDHLTSTEMVEVKEGDNVFTFDVKTRVAAKR